MSQAEERIINCLEMLADEIVFSRNQSPVFKEKLNEEDDLHNKENDLSGTESTSSSSGSGRFSRTLHKSPPSQIGDKLSSSSSSSCVNSSGIGSTHLSPQHEYDLSRSPSTETFLPMQQPQLIRKRDNSVASQASCGTARSSSSSQKFLDSKEGISFLLGGGGSSSATSSTSGKKQRKEVIPQRKRRDFIPNELKDDSYWERRRKNNLAAKRSREKRRLNDIVLETKVLELTNLNNAIKLKLDLCLKTYDISEEQVEKMFEENKHLLVIQEALDMSELLTNEDSLTAHGSYDNENEHLSVSSSASSASSLSGKKMSSFGKELSSMNSPPDSLLILPNSVDSSSIHSNQLTSSSAGDVDCDGFNDAVSESELEIDENLDTIVEGDDDKNGQVETQPLDDIEPEHEEHELEEAHLNDAYSPPSKRKLTNTVEAPQVEKPSVTNELQALKAKLDRTNDSIKAPINNDGQQMKSQYPLLYNQLCKTVHSEPANKVKPPRTNEKSFTIEQQNQILLSHILNRAGNPAAADFNGNPMVNTLLNELLMRNELNKQNNNNNNSSSSSSISISSLLKPHNNATEGSSDILTKILTSPGPGGAPTTNILMERLGSLLKAPAQTTPKANLPQQSPANALMEKYKNLINKTNNNNNNTNSQTLVTQQPTQQQGSTNSNHSTSRKAQNVVHKAAVAPSALKNTVNNLLQGFSTSNYTQQEQQPMENVKVIKSASSSRKRHLNQAEPVSKKLNNESTVDSNNFALAYAMQQQQNGRGAQPDLNEMVSMMLSASSAVAAQQQQRHNQRHLNNAQIKHNNSASTKNQTYNQLLLLHHNQKLQQQQQLMQKQQQHDGRAMFLQEELLKCASPIASEQLNALQANASNLIYQQQQQQANFSNQANGSSGDNMPLKLRFKMLQLKTGEVN